MEMVGKLLLLLLLLTTIACAAGERNTITHLKGFDGPLPFSLETGYVEVEDTHGVELFYYFIESERNPAEDPVILWISGGPGCSGLNALFFEIGPLKLDAEGYAAAGGTGLPGLLYFEDSWTKVSNVIFVDAPAGSGFSYAREAEGLNGTLTGLGRQLRVFLHKWMAEHPEMASNPLYIGGDSYSGYTVTVTALEVDKDNQEGDDQRMKLNLKGYMVGNARGDINYDNSGKIPLMHGLGLISDELYEAALRSCSSTVSRRNKKRCSDAVKAIREVTAGVNPMNILKPACGVDYYARPDPTPTDLNLKSEEDDEEEEGTRRLLLHLDSEVVVMPLECNLNFTHLPSIWANDPEVMYILGVREGSISIGSWSLCPDLPHFQTDVRSTIPYHRNLTRRGYRALVYNGDHDLLVPFLGTQAWIRSLGYPVVAPWRPWYDSYDEVAGFTTEYAYNLTFSTIKGGGHMAPVSHPKQCLHMLKKWTSPAGRL